MIFLLLYYVVLFYLGKFCIEMIQSHQLLKEEQYFEYLIKNKDNFELTDNMWNLCMYFIKHIENKEEWIKNEKIKK